MPRTLITLPCTARELENALRSACDFEGLWEAQVGLAMNGPQPPRIVLSCPPSETAASEQTTTTIQGEAK